MLHLASAGHAFPQAPQCPTSVLVITQRPAHSVVVDPHIVAHVPALHTSPAAHARPHMPQFAGSVLVATQAPAHSVSGGD